MVPDAIRYEVGDLGVWRRTLFEEFIIDRWKP
jgi:hypothetical protein